MGGAYRRACLLSDVWWSIGNRLRAARFASEIRDRHEPVQIKTITSLWSEPRER